MTIAAQLGSQPPHRESVAQAGARAGIGEVWEIAPGRGRKPHYDQAKRDAIINSTLQTKPKGMTHWSCRLMAEAQGVSKNTVNRLWQLHNHQAAPEPDVQAFAGCEIPGEADRCGGAVSEPAAKGGGALFG